MPFEPIPFTSMDLNIDKPSLTASYGQLQQDGYWKRYVGPNGPAFMWVKRPGLTAWADLSDSDKVWDIFYSQKADKIIAVLKTNGQVYKIGLGSTAAINEMTGTALMDGIYRPSFAEFANGAKIYIANGNDIGEYTLASNTGAYIADADCPTEVNSVATLNNILIACRTDSRRFDWSDAGDAAAWSGEYAATESAPGYNRRMIAANNYLWFFKADAIEVWRDDGASFVRETQGSLKVGCRNDGSIRFINGSFYFLDNNLEVRRLTGMQYPEIISNPNITGYIAAAVDFGRVEGHYLRHDGKDFYILQWGGSGANVSALVYDIDLAQWYLWGTYTGSAYERWGVSGICTDQSGIWYAGDFNIGKVHKISGTQDLTTDIRTVLRTDSINRNAPDQYKYCHELVMVFKRADISAGTPKTMSIRYRDEGSETWSSAITTDIEVVSSTELKSNIRRLGRYKSRVWEFVMSSATQAALISAYERYDVGK